MDQTEQETQKDDPAIEVTDLPSTGSKRDAYALQATTGALRWYYLTKVPN